MNAPASARGGRPSPKAALAGALVFGLSLTACEATTMTARHSNTAVLIGPVGCIGCAPAPLPVPADPDAVPPGAIVDSTSYTAFAGGGATGSASSRETVFSALGVKADLAAPDPCKRDLQVTRLRAMATGSGAVFLWYQKVALDLEAVRVNVRRGVCGPRPWPYAGPDGIVMLDAPATPPPAAPPPPAAAPPAAPDDEETP